MIKEVEKRDKNVREIAKNLDLICTLVEKQGMYLEDLTDLVVHQFGKLIIADNFGDFIELARNRKSYRVALNGYQIDDFSLRKINESWKRLQMLGIEKILTSKKYKCKTYFQNNNTNDTIFIAINKCLDSVYEGKISSQSAINFVHTVSDCYYGKRVSKVCELTR